jgi:diaminopimelate decarboxylase
MHHFHLQNGELYAESVPLRTLAATYGTPLYVYSEQTLTDHFDRLNEALAPIDHLICYAVKANSNLAVLKVLAERGAGFDLVSGGELTRVERAGGNPSKCSFAGVGKTRAEIEQALAAKIYVFNVESFGELEFINQIAGERGEIAPVAMRVNPNVDAHTHAKITTGTYENKFGIAYEQILPLYYAASQLKNIQLRGLQMHIGSQITEVTPFVQAVQKVVPLVEQLKAKFGIEFFSIGGGLGIVYQEALASGGPDWWQAKGEQSPLTPKVYGEHIIPLLKPLGVKIVIEPGRFIAGNAGALLTEVLYVKKTGQKTFVIVDAGMNDLIRPAFYESYHEIVPLKAAPNGTLVPTDLVGPVCESGDAFCHDRPLPVLQSGDKLALLSAGAYGFTMASNYNTRARPAEIMVKGGTHRVVRSRETVDDLLRGESV